MVPATLKDNKDTTLNAPLLTVLPSHHSSWVLSFHYCLYPEIVHIPAFVYLSSLTGSKLKIERPLRGGNESSTSGIGGHGDVYLLPFSLVRLDSMENMEEKEEWITAVCDEAVFRLQIYFDRE